MSSITIGADDFDVYQDVSEIDSYAAGAVGESADAWRAADPATTQPRAAISATRTLDRQIWQGEKTDSDQVHAFPRTGLTYPDGTAVDPDTVPQALLDANSELAMALTSDAAALNADTTNTTKRLKAGSVEIEYFRAAGTGTRFPLSLMELIGFWLGGVSSVDGSESTGVSDCTDFDGRYQLTGGF